MIDKHKCSDQLKQTTKNEEEHYEISCSLITSFGCERCKDGYYLEHYSCKKCKEECYKCRDGISCSECYEGNTTVNGKCIPVSEFSRNCKKLLPGNVGCAKCDDGYYRNGIECNKCPEGCSSCLDNS